MKKYPHALECVGVVVSAMSVCVHFRLQSTKRKYAVKSPSQHVTNFKLRKVIPSERETSKYRSAIIPKYSKISKMN